MAIVYGLPTSALIQRRTPKSDFIPKDFAEMYQHYYVYVLKLVVQQGIDYQDADDIAQTMFVKMNEKGLLEQFDPEREFYGRPAVFTTLVSGFVLKYVRHYRERQGITQARELTYIDQDAEGAQTKSSDSENDGLNTWLDTYGPVFEDEYTDVTDAEFLRDVRAHLATAPTGRKDSRLDFVALFEEIRIQVDADGKYDTSVLMERFGVTRTTIHNWLEKLRIEVAKAVADRA